MQAGSRKNLAVSPVVCSQEWVSAWSFPHELPTRSDSAGAMSRAPSARACQGRWKCDFQLPAPVRASCRSSGKAHPSGNSAGAVVSQNGCSSLCGAAAFLFFPLVPDLKIRVVVWGRWGTLLTWRIFHRKALCLGTLPKAFAKYAL